MWFFRRCVSPKSSAPESPPPRPPPAMQYGEDNIVVDETVYAPPLLREQQLTATSSSAHATFRNNDQVLPPQTTKTPADHDDETTSSSEKNYQKKDDEVLPQLVKSVNDIKKENEEEITHLPLAFSIDDSTEDDNNKEEEKTMTPPPPSSSSSLASPDSCETVIIKQDAEVALPTSNSALVDVHESTDAAAAMPHQLLECNPINIDDVAGRENKDDETAAVVSHTETSSLDDDNEKTDQDGAILPPNVDDVSSDNHDTSEKTSLPEPLEYTSKEFDVVGIPPQQTLLVTKNKDKSNHVEKAHDIRREDLSNHTLTTKVNMNDDATKEDAPVVVNNLDSSAHNYVNENQIDEELPPQIFVVTKSKDQDKDITGRMLMAENNQSKEKEKKAVLDLIELEKRAPPPPPPLSELPDDDITDDDDEVVKLPTIISSTIKKKCNASSDLESSLTVMISPTSSSAALAPPHEMSRQRDEKSAIATARAAVEDDDTYMVEDALQLFEHFCDLSGVITAVQFLRMHSVLKDANLTKSAYIETLREIDTDGNGFIDHEQYRRWVELRFSKLTDERPSSLSLQSSIQSEKYTIFADLDLDEHTQTEMRLYSRIKKATNRKTKDAFLVKMFNKQWLDDEFSMTDIHNEVAIMKVLAGHPYVARFYEVVENDALIFLVSEYADSRLSERIAQRIVYGEAEARVLAWQLLDTLAFMQSRGVIHRNIAPEVILLKHTDFDIMLSDFGWATTFSDEEAQILGAPVGTNSAYAAPELIPQTDDGVCTYDFRIDIWSVGVLIYVLLCARLPFGDHNENGLRQMLQNIKEGSYDQCKGNEWDFVIDAGKDLIRSILLVHPGHRMTVDQAIQHPWFHHHDAVPVDDDASSMTLADHLLQQHSFHLSHSSSSARSRTGSVCSASPMQEHRKSLNQKRRSSRSSAIADNVLSGRSSLSAWLKANQFEDFEDRVRHLADTVEALKSVTDSDFEKFCNTVRVPKLRARRFRRALVNLGAPVTLK